MVSFGEMPEIQVFRIVLFYSVMIIVMPVVSFFGCKTFLFDGLLQLSSIQSNVYSALSAVIALHIALGFFIHRAYFNSEAPVKPDKID